MLGPDPLRGDEALVSCPAYNALWSLPEPWAC